VKLKKPDHLLAGMLCFGGACFGAGGLIMMAFQKPWMPHTGQVYFIAGMVGIMIGTGLFVYSMLVDWITEWLNTK